MTNNAALFGSITGDPIRRLVIGGMLLIAAIVVGTAVMIINFRERALNSHAHGLTAARLLPVHHFDQPFELFEVVRRDEVLPMVGNRSNSSGDGTHYPHVGEPLGRRAPTGPIFQILSSADRGLAEMGGADGQNRSASVHQLGNFPIVAVATTGVLTALADWRDQARFLIGLAGLLVFAIVVMLFLIVRQLSRQQQLSERRFALEKQRLDVAVNNMPQSLLLFDSSDRLIVCNERYLEMFNLSPDVVKPGCSFRDLIAHRKETGSFNGDIDEYCSSVLRNARLGQITRTLVENPDGRSIQIVNQPLLDGGWVTTLEDVTEGRRAEERIRHLAHYDALTDLPNRALFREYLEQELKSIVPGQQIALLYIDIDGFKSVNDSFGHRVGDELLKQVTARLSQCLDSTDFIARLGGDEFAIVLTAAKHRGDVTDLVSRIYQSIREPFVCIGHQVVSDASIGIALAPQDGVDLDHLLQSADLAMYRAKADGRRTYRFFEPIMDSLARARRLLEADLREAIIHGGFEVHYQPVVDLSTYRLCGCEALLRWRHPDRGMISPAEFIPVAEQTGLINKLGEWVLSTACAEAATWPDNIKLAVNVSPVQFRNDTLALRIAATLAASGLAPGRLELEVTEAVLMRDDEAALAILHELRSIGVRIALDDFGTGYSSLSYLQRFPFDKIKIDRCFVNDLTEVDGSSCIVQAVVNIAAARQMITTAEGVETEQQRDLLRRLGCTEMQGYLFSAALPAADLRQFFLARSGVAIAAA